MFHWAMAAETASASRSGHRGISFILADYNPTVLQLVTLPNFILAWALYHKQQPVPLPALQDAFSLEGELELTPDVLDGFCRYLSDHAFHLSFLSGGWSSEFVDLLYSLPAHPPMQSGEADAGCVSLLLGAETIYSPFALQAFADMVSAVLEREAGSPSTDASAWVAAKKLYFGVGGSLDDFVDTIRSKGVIVDAVREESEGVRRGVVRCTRPRN